MKRWTLWRVFFRSLFIQAGFSPEALQTLGLLYALEPALLELYPDEAVRRAVVQRHLTPFNTHPYVATGLVGGILFHEVRVARGEEPAERVNHFKTSLMGPLAALGDGFFWLSLRPAVGAFAVLLVPVLNVWAALVFFVLFNTVHLWLRGSLFLLGWRLGDAMVGRLAAARLPVWSNRLRTLAAACAGLIGAWLSVRFGAQAGGAMTPWLVAIAAVIGMGTLALSERRVRPIWLMYGLAALAITAELVLT
jgi:mannose PTS system EIID component